MVRCLGHGLSSWSFEGNDRGADRSISDFEDESGVQHQVVAPGLALAEKSTRKKGARRRPAVRDSAAEVSATIVRDVVPEVTPGNSDCCGMFTLDIPNDLTYRSYDQPLVLRWIHIKQAGHLMATGLFS